MDPYTLCVYLISFAQHVFEICPNRTYQWFVLSD